MSHDAPFLDADDLRDALIRSGNSYVELHARSGVDGRFAPEPAMRPIRFVRFAYQSLDRYLRKHRPVLVSADHLTPALWLRQTMARP
jgi:hypothetical protein